ncbi:MAG TPA: Ig-like domain-containing protein [Kofleriaceae bacterium]
MIAAACSSDAGPPPMIEQVRLTELESQGPDGVARSVFGFGTHPDAAAADVHVVTAASPDTSLRVIVNKRLAGRTLEELECRYVVDDDVFAPLPDGVVPDDVLRCAADQDQLAAQCPGSSPRSLCICQNAGGCPSGSNPDGSEHRTPRCESVGVQDRDKDGTADATRLIAAHARLTCGAFDVPIDVGHSVWSPAGSQDRPLTLTGSFDQLGPAIVLVTQAPLPTGQACSLALPGVTDDDGVALCAPPDGVLAAGCTPGDTGAFGFSVVPMAFFANPPVLAIGQSRSDDVLIQAPTSIDAASLANLTVVEGAATPYAKFIATLPIPSVIRIRWTDGLAPNTRYTIVIPTSVTDLYRLSAPLPVQISFTTGN